MVGRVVSFDPRRLSIPKVTESGQVILILLAGFCTNNLPWAPIPAPIWLSLSFNRDYICTVVVVVEVKKTSVASQLEPYRTRRLRRVDYNRRRFIVVING